MQGIKSVNIYKFNIDRIYFMKSYGMRKKGYFSLMVITVFSTLYILRGVESFVKGNLTAYEAQERKTSPPE